MTRPRALAAASVLALAALAAPAVATAQNRPAFEAQLDDLRARVGIPSMSVAVVEGGTVVWVRHFGIDARPGDTVRYPVASITKPMAAVLTMRLVERGRLSLDQPVPAAGKGVEVRHLLSHTSAGTPGGRFLYSSALFARLETPLAEAAGASFPSALAAEVFRPLGLGATTAGRGATPATGVVSTVEDLGRFAAAVERGDLLADRATAEMFRPPRGRDGRPLPSALGWFVQTVGGEQVRWQFGQQADASALVLNLPRRRMSFILLARGDRASAPFWLQFGDARWSPFAFAFLSTWARMRIDLAAARGVMIDALIALADHRPADGAALASRASILAPALTNSPEPGLLAAFARAGRADLRDMGRRIAGRLLAVDASNPRTLLDLAVLELQEGHPDEAARRLDGVLEQGLATPEIERAVRDLLKEPGR